MVGNLIEIKNKIYDKCSFIISDLKVNPESKEYGGCQFSLNGKIIIYRSSKITPKKAGQFVTFWKRNDKGITEPFFETDAVDYYVINSEIENCLGQFVFPKSILIEKNIISTSKKEGKRGFRVYAPWDKTESKQAIATQKWQSNYFFLIEVSTNLKKVKKLYSNP